MAFTGWSDTGTVTTDVITRLVEAYGGERFLTVDAEDYFVFTDSRPHVRIDDGGAGVVMVVDPASGRIVGRFSGRDAQAMP